MSDVDVLIVALASLALACLALGFAIGTYLRTREIARLARRHPARMWTVKTERRL